MGERAHFAEGAGLGVLVVSAECGLVLEPLRLRLAVGLVLVLLLGTFVLGLGGFRLLFLGFRGRSLVLILNDGRRLMLREELLWGCATVSER